MRKTWFCITTRGRITAKTLPTLSSGSSHQLASKDTLVSKDCRWSSGTFQITSAETTSDPADGSCKLINMIHNFTFDMPDMTLLAFV